MARWLSVVFPAVFFLSIQLIKVQGVYQGQKYIVTEGTPDCISNCSLFSPGIPCDVTECESVPETNDGSEKAQDISISFEISKNELSGKNELALKVEWSPEDYATVERVIGYMVEIGDGSTSIKKCYNLGENLKFSNIKDIYYNDCFGKANGTTVILGSSVEVSVTTLPIKSDDPSASKESFLVNVPDCTYEKFLNLSQCFEERKMRKDCAFGCSTSFDEINNVIHPIFCSVSERTAHPPSPDMSGTFEVVQCPEIQQNTSQPAPAPQGLEVNWYKYRDRQSNDIKLALNISWALDSNATSDPLEYLSGFVIFIYSQTSSDFVTKCLAIDTQLNKEKHSQPKFFYDCIGRNDDFSVKPNMELNFFMESLPSSGDKFDKYELKIPNCNDPTMHGVSNCKTEPVHPPDNEFFGQVMEFYCEEKLFEFSYNVNPAYGSKVNIVMCKQQEDSSCTLTWQTTRNSLSGTLNISIPQSINISSKYSVFTFGDSNLQRFGDSVTFKSCINSTQPAHKTKETFIIVVIAIAVVLVILVAGIILWRRKFKDQLQDARTEHPKPNTTVKNSPVEIIPPGKIRIFVVFESDHQLHKDVIDRFCRVLKVDLSLDVHLSLWEDEVMAQNKANYLWKNLAEADKVVLVCSSGTRQGFGDYYKPVMDRVFQGKEPQKYLTVYFDYSSQDDIPEEVRNSTVEIFKLLSQFELFYFRLIAVEKYQDSIKTFKKIPSEEDSESNTASAKELLLSIERMRHFVSENPTWYNDKNGQDIAGSNSNGFCLPSNGITEHISLLPSNEARFEDS